MKITLVTGNKHKAAEISRILSSYGIEVKHFNGEKEESFRASVEHTAKHNAKIYAELLNGPVVVDDSGIEFMAYPGFPLQNAKWAFEKLGYKGLLKLFDARTSRKARFVCAAAYCEPGKKPKTFVGYLEGSIAKTVQCRNKDVMAYERIFVPQDSDKVLAKHTRKQKNEMSHRAVAFKKLGLSLSKEKTKKQSNKTSKRGKK